MRQRVIADGHTIIVTQGIRFVERLDSAWSSRTDFNLRVTYKGDVLNYTYPDSATRDAQFNALRASMQSATVT